MQHVQNFFRFLRHRHTHYRHIDSHQWQSLTLTPDHTSGSIQTKGTFNTTAQTYRSRQPGSGISEFIPGHRYPAKHNQQDDAMRQEANMIYVNHIDNIKNIELCALYTWLLSIDDELFTKISDVSYARRDSAKVIKLLDTLRLVIRIDASASCRNAITHLRSMTTVDILAAAVSFGVTRTKTEKFIESLCVMTRTIYGSHTPLSLLTTEAMQDYCTAQP